ncbi:diaminopimelate epimerase [Fibrobacterota bacterium]
MKFTKMHGAGNDYVYIDCFQEQVSDAVELAKRVSHRRFGIGSDGLVLMRPFNEGDAEMVIYNADGSQAEMCGNGLRCVAKYMHDHYAKGKPELKLLTGRGVLTARIHAANDGLAHAVTIDLGEPVFDGRQVPVTIDRPRIIDQPIDIEGTEYRFSALSMGNPHCVIYVPDVAAFPVTDIGPQIENHPYFPARVNVEFVQLVSEHELIQRTWERGSGETWACGTGAAAVAVISRLTGKTGNKVTIHLKGGDLEMEYSEGSSVKMTGPAVEVFSGEWRE